MPVYIDCLVFQCKAGFSVVQMESKNAKCGEVETLQHEKKNGQEYIVPRKLKKSNKM